MDRLCSCRDRVNMKRTNRRTSRDREGLAALPCAPRYRKKLMMHTKCKRGFLWGWIGVAFVTVFLTASPAFGFFPLAKLPWSGPGVLLTWSLAAFDMPPSAPFILWSGIGLPSERIEPLWPYLLLAMGVILTVTPAVILGTTRIWTSTVGRHAFIAYSILYFLALIGGGVYTAIEWHSILD